MKFLKTYSSGRTGYEVGFRNCGRAFPKLVLYPGDIVKKVNEIVESDTWYGTPEQRQIRLEKISGLLVSEQIFYSSIQKGFDCHFGERIYATVAKDNDVCQDPEKVKFYFIGIRKTPESELTQEQKKQIEDFRK